MDFKVSALLSVDLLKEYDPYYKYAEHVTWELEDHDEDALTEEQLVPNEIEDSKSRHRPKTEPGNRDVTGLTI